MTARTRPDVQPWNPVYQPEHVSGIPNLLVSGCSYTDNISMTETVTWPWYLKTLLGFQQVLDCSQSGAGNNHIHNSIINECETNPEVTAESTLVIVMWSGWSRADVIGHQSITRTIHPISNYDFSPSYSTFSLFRNPRDNKSPAEKLCEQYSRVIEPEAQVYESSLRIVGLKNYLENKKIPHVFIPWKNLGAEYKFVKDQHVDLLGQQIESFMANITCLDDYAKQRHLVAPDGHPSTEAHLRWSRNILMPYLLEHVQGV